jgi:ATP-binding cassette, subfamily B (MDR/TAP), member 1
VFFISLTISRAGGVAEETISSIRTVATFSGEIKEGDRYESQLKNSIRTGITTGRVMGGGFGMVMLTVSYFVISFHFIFDRENVYVAYAIAFWYGADLITRHIYNGSVHSDWTVFNCLPQIA